VRAENATAAPVAAAKLAVEIKAVLAEYARMPPVDYAHLHFPDPVWDSQAVTEEHREKVLAKYRILATPGAALSSEELALIIERKPEFVAILKAEQKAPAEPVAIA
jgi:hypothetical protein